MSVRECTCTHIVHTHNAHAHGANIIFLQMGFDGLFFSRVDYDDKVQRLNDKTMEMVWRPSRSLGKATDLFTGILIRGYSPPPGFCFDQRCIVPPMQVNHIVSRVDTVYAENLIGN